MTRPSTLRRAETVLIVAVLGGIIAALACVSVVLLIAAATGWTLG